MAYQDFLLDKRIVQRNIVKGVVDPKEHDKLLAKLPDRADNVTTGGSQVDDDDDTLDDDLDEGDDES